MEIFWKLSLLVSFFAVASATTVDLGCDPGWLISSGTCYYFNNQKKVTWSEAMTECNRYDASPIFFETQAELAWYVNVTKSQYPSSGYWTSMNDFSNNDQSAPGTGYWSWGMHEYVDTSLLKWSSSPANDGRPACGGVNLQGKMYDADCNSKQGYICMIDNGATLGCPLGWLNTDTDCYYVSNTTNPSQLMTWTQAKTQCTSMDPNGHLFVIDDPNDVNFLVGQLPFVSKTTYLHWTGLQGTGQPGGWTWLNGATVNQQMFSWVAEPDSVAGKENCGVVRYNGKFSDRGCNIKQNYICRKPEYEMDASFNLGCGLWTRAGNKCYQFYTAPRSTWTDAKQICTSIQGDLINVNNIDLRAWLIQQMQDTGNSGRFYWTALNDRDTEGVYKWGDGSVLDSNTISWNQEPNNWMGNEDCAYMYVTGEFNDVSCAFQSAPLCELDNVQTCPTTGGTWASMTADTGSGQNCYLFGSYSNRSQLMTQQEASDFCTGLSYQKVNPGGAMITYIPKLYTVNSQAEATFIVQQMKKYQDNSNGYWTSLNDKQSEGFWQFGRDPNSDTSFVNWNTEPSTSTADTDCVGTGYGGNFYVRKCSVKFPFICERPANLIGSASSVRNSYWLMATVMIVSILRMFH